MVGYWAGYWMSMSLILPHCSTMACLEAMLTQDLAFKLSILDKSENIGRKTQKVGLNWQREN